MTHFLIDEVKSIKLLLTSSFSDGPVIKRRIREDSRFVDAAFTNNEVHQYQEEIHHDPA